MCDSELLFLQEICLYETALNKLLKLGYNSDMIATSAMDEFIQRIGRRFGGVAIIWNSSIKLKLVKIACISNQVCGLLYGDNDSLTMLLNVYVPCDKNTDDHAFINVLNTISQLLYKHNPCHIIIGGDMNVDFSRSSPNTRVLSDFITDFNLYICIDLPNTNAPYTFIKYNNSTSRIDHFFGSESFSRAVDNCNIIDNHLFSDHVPLRLVLHIGVDYITVTSRPFSVKQVGIKRRNVI